MKTIFSVLFFIVALTLLFGTLKYLLGLVNAGFNIPGFCVLVAVVIILTVVFHEELSE